MSDIEFIDGMIVKAPRDNAPDFVKMIGSIKRADLIAWLANRDGDWINFDVKESKSGKWYCAVNQWKPKEKDSTPDPNTSKSSDSDLEDLPF